MKKKIIALLMAATMTVSMAACGASEETKVPEEKENVEDAESGEKEEAEETKESAEDVTLTAWAWTKTFNIYAMETATEVYSKTHDRKINVDITDIPSQEVEAKIIAAVSAGDLSTLPDIFLLQDNSFQKFMTVYPEIFTDLTDSGIDYSQFPEAKTAYSVKDGKNYGVPFDNGAVTHCIRRDFLEQAGFTPEDFMDLTWSEYMEKAKVVKEKTGLPMLSSQSGSPDLLMMMMQSCGSSAFLEDGSVNIENNQALRESMQIYRQMVEDGTLLEVVDWEAYCSSLYNGSVAANINGCWMLSVITPEESQSGKWAIVNMPRLETVENATNYSNNGGSTWVVSSTCKDPEAAKELFRETFAGSKDLYDELISVGALATWIPAGESDVYEQEVPYFGGQKVYSTIVDFASRTPSNITGPYYYDAQNAIGVALSEMIQMDGDLDEVLKTAQETVEFNMGG